MTGTCGNKPQLQDEITGCWADGSRWCTVMVLGLSFWPQPKQPHDPPSSVAANAQRHGYSPVAVELVGGEDGFDSYFKFIVPLTGIPEPVEATTVNAKMYG